MLPQQKRYSGDLNLVADLLSGSKSLREASKVTCQWSVLSLSENFMGGNLWRTNNDLKPIYDRASRKSVQTSAFQLNI